MGKLVIDGNSVYEIDEDCIQRKEEWERRKNKDWKGEGRETSSQETNDRGLR